MIHAQTFRAQVGLRPMLGAILGLVGFASHGGEWVPPENAPPRSIDEALSMPLTSDKGDSYSIESTPPQTLDMATSAPALMDFSLDYALQMAMAQNQEIDVQEFAPLNAELAVSEAKSAFDPFFSVSASRGGQNSASERTGAGTVAAGQSALANFVREARILAAYLEPPETTIIKSDSFNTTARLSQVLPTGTEWSLSAGYSWQDRSQALKSRTGSWSATVTQPLLRGFGTSVNLVSIRRAGNSQANADWAFRGFAQSIAAETESAYWELALAQENLRIRQFSMELAQEQLDRNDVLIAVGSLAESVRISAEAEVASQRAQLASAEATLHARAINLWRLLNPAELAPAAFEAASIVLPDIDAPELDARTSMHLAEVFRPGLAQARIDVANGELSVLESRNSLLPNLDVYLTYGASSTGAASGAWNDYLDSSGGRQFEVGLSFSVNIGRRAEKARFQRARIERDQAEAALRSLRQRIEAELRNAINDLKSQFAQLAASRQEVLSREEEYDVETERFRLGQSTNLDVLQVQQNLIQAKVQVVTAHVRYLQGLTTLFEAEGTLLTRRGMMLEMEKEIGI